MPRKVIDCRDTPNQANCTLTLVGEEGEVVRAAAQHAAAVHGHADTPALREVLRRALRDEADVYGPPREPEFHAGLEATPLTSPH